MAQTEILISSTESLRQYCRSLWAYRELLYFLTWRDVLVRYKQTTVGVLWALFKPVITIATLTFVFGKVSNVPSYGIAYPILVATGTIPWLYFSACVNESSLSIVGNSGLISKIYFPRLIIPVSTLLVAAIDLLIGLLCMFGYMLAQGWRPEKAFALLPLFLGLLFLVTLGIGILVSALVVRYRDVKFLIPFLIQSGLYLSPVGFASQAIPEKWRLIFSINPMVGVIDGMRWALCGLPPYWPGIVWSFIFGLGFCFAGIASFRRLESTFADII